MAGRRAAKPSTVEAAEQAATPLLEALRAYDGAAFHCPGHKRGRGVSTDLRATVGDAVLASDVWLETGAYDRARRAAESLAARAWGAHRAYVLGNGSTSGNHAFLLAHLCDGDTAVVSRTLHTSTLTGLVLTGARPVYVTPRVHPDLGTGLGIDPADVAAALAAHPGTRLVSLVSPSYTGVCSDTAAICAAARAAGAVAYVDEAWGPHLAFHPDLPVHAMAAGADGAVTSVHKLLPAMSSGALLLAGPSVDGDRLDAVVRMTQTTSPLLPLLASVDAARRDLAVGGSASWSARSRWPRRPGGRCRRSPASGCSGPTSSASDWTRSSSPSTSPTSVSPVTAPMRCCARRAASPRRGPTSPASTWSWGPGTTRRLSRR